MPPVAPATPRPRTAVLTARLAAGDIGMTTTKAVRVHAARAAVRRHRVERVGGAAKSSVDWGRRDGAAAVSADLLKRNMFMKLSGDPNFDTKQGRFVQMPMRSLDPSLRRK